MFERRDFETGSVWMFLTKGTVQRPGFCSYTGRFGPTCETVTLNVFVTKIECVIS